MCRVCFVIYDDAICFTVELTCSEDQFIVGFSLDSEDISDYFGLHNETGCVWF